MSGTEVFVPHPCMHADWAMLSGEDLESEDPSFTLLHTFSRNVYSDRRIYLSALILFYDRCALCLLSRLPESLGNLTALRYIDLSWNNITGERDTRVWIGTLMMVASQQRAWVYTGLLLCRRPL